MTLVLTGTGPAAGFPVPGCPCAACSPAGRSDRAAGAPGPRRPAELVLDGRWRFDIEGAVHEGPGGARRPAAGQELELPGLTAVGLGTDGLLLRPHGQPPLLWAPQAGLLD